MENSYKMQPISSLKIAKFNAFFLYNWNKPYLIFLDGWTTADLIYKWKQEEPVQIVKDLNLPRFKLEKFSTDYCNSKTNTGN